MNHMPAEEPGHSPGNVVLLEPLAPLIIRSGRPFDSQSGVDPVRFPPPSTLAGCLRTHWSQNSGLPYSSELLQHQVAGPLLVREQETGHHHLMVPKPSDAFYFGHDKDARCIRAVPEKPTKGCGSDLPDDLLPLRLVQEVRGKPGNGPGWWSYDDWLAFKAGEAIEVSQLERNGWTPPTGDRRTHVAIDPASKAAEASKLFQTVGLEFAPPPPYQSDQSAYSPLLLMARFSQPMNAGVVNLGGERRLAALSPQPDEAWPGLSTDQARQIIETGGFSVTLLTPGLFAGGYRPAWIGPDGTGSPDCAPALRLRLRAAALERWQAHSGWNLAANAARPTRKLVPAGAVYWFELVGPAEPEQIRSLYLQSLADDAQDRLDGYALGLLHPWSPIDRP